MEPKPMTIRKLLSLETRKYRARYWRMFGLERYERPEHAIPGSDHSLAVGPFLVSRPYPISIEGLDELLSFCHKYDLEVQLGGLSGWHPLTVLIRVWKPEFLDEFRQRARSHGDSFELEVWDAMRDKWQAAVRRVRILGHDSGVYIYATETWYYWAHRTKAPIDSIIKLAPGYSLDKECE